MKHTKTAVWAAAFSFCLLTGLPCGTGQFAPEALAQSPPATQAPGPAAPAQAPAQTAPADPLAEAQLQVQGWNQVLDGIQKALARDGVTEQEFDEYSRETADIDKAASTLASQLAPKVAEIQQQIKQLGPVPAEGETQEDAAVAERRKSLQEALNKVDTPLRESRLVLVRAKQISSAIASKRRERFLGALMQRSRTVFDPGLWTDSIAGVPRYAKSFALVLSESMSATTRKVASSPSTFMLLLLQLLAGFGVFFYLRRLFRRRFETGEPDDPGTAGEPVSAAGHLGDFVRNGILPAILLIFAGRMIVASNLVADRLAQILTNSIGTIAALLITFALLRIFLRPVRPELRIAHLDNRSARSAFAVGTATLLVVSVLRIFDILAVLLLAPLEMSIVLGTLVSLVSIIGTVRILMIVASGRHAAQPDAIAAPNRLLRWQYVRSVLWLAIFVSAGALVFGFNALSVFVWYETIIVLSVVAVLWLVIRWIDQTKQAAFEPGQNTFERFSANTGISVATARQSTVLGFGLLRMLVSVLAIALILLTWGVQTSDWLIWVNRAFFGFQVGELTISISGILTALVLFIVGIIITRTIQNWVATQYLPTTSLDAGLRNSIATVLGYVGFVLAAVLAIGSAGLDLSNIALVAGALSVGIGLGLQSIVNNFVSGLILLAERPIKAGDWIITAAGEGTVRRISVRSTEIETFDRATVIVPNSTLITESLTNWTHRSKLGRIIVTVGVGYGSDPDEVKRILLECARDHPTVLKRPEPMVFFMDFGADALIFDVRAWVADIGEGFGVKSDLRFEILRRLRAAKIEIPFPQRDVHIRSGLEALAASGPPERPDEPRPRSRKRPAPDRGA